MCCRVAVSAWVSASAGTRSSSPRLNENFHNRGRRSEEQAQVMQALWAQPHVTFKGKYHTIDDAGINPRPASGRIPLWYGGHHEHTLPRIAKWGDGWMPNAYPPDQSALDIFGQLAPPDRTSRPRSGRRRHRGLDIVRRGHRSGLAQGDRVLEAGRRQPHLPDHDVQPAASAPPHPGKTVGDHLAAMKRYREAVFTAIFFRKSKHMQLGATIPVADIGTGPSSKSATTPRPSKAWASTTCRPPTTCWAPIRQRSPARAG